MSKPVRNEATLGPRQAIALANAKAGRLRGSGAPKRVVILGGGFAGVYTAKNLRRLLGRRRDVEVELLSEENYFVFQPLLPEVAAGGISATHVVNPIREMVPGVLFRCCRVLSVDLEDRSVVVSQGDGRVLERVPYDHLVFCLGKVTSFASMPGAAEHAFAMKDLSDAFKLKNHVLCCLEHADIETDPGKKARLLSFVVAGGGFSGVETIGELRELVSRSLKYFTRIAAGEVKFRLVHSQDAILPEMPERLRRAARKILEERAIELVLGARVKAASPTRVYLTDGRSFETRTFVCTVGNAPNPIVAYLLSNRGFEEGSIGGRRLGAFATDRHLQCVGRPGYWAVGDCAAIPSPSGDGLCPPTAQFAIREAATCARNILATIDARPMRPFAFKALGLLASLGERRAVASILGLPLTGFIAWFLWRTIYLSKLPGAVRRLRVTIDWTLDLLFPRDITQLQVFRLDRLTVHHYQPGEVIVEKGEIGRELYMIREGEVEVYEPSERGEHRILGKLGAQDVFGERALLEDTPRTASVRALGPVDVVVMSRRDFRSVVTQFPQLEQHFAMLLRERHPRALPTDALLECMPDGGAQRP
jgi:NADH dehydrogenase